MHILALVLLGFLLLTAFIQAAFAIRFVRKFYRPAEPAVEELPTATILVALKGADPYLGEGLQRLFRQNYPHYDVRIVVDHREDPAWRVAEEAIRRSGAANVHLSVHEERPDTCGLICSALAQEARKALDSSQIIAVADGDAMAYPNWLRDLVTALLRDPRLGAAFGNRWYFPREGRWGSIVRYLWNAAAIVPMDVFEIPWGGSCAMRTSAMREGRLIEKWLRDAVPDASMEAAMRELGLRSGFVPSVMMINREECGLLPCADFIFRQLTWTRLHNSRWPVILLHAFVTTGALGLALGLTLWGWLMGQPSVAAIAGGGLAGYWLVMLLLLALLETGVRQAARAQGEPTGWLSWPTLAKIAVAIPLAQCIQLLAALRAHFTTRVRFRGLTYVIRGPHDIRIEQYQPFNQCSQPADSKTSL